MITSGISSDSNIWSSAGGVNTPSGHTAIIGTFVFCFMGKACSLYFYASFFAFGFAVLYSLLCYFLLIEHEGHRPAISTLRCSCTSVGLNFKQEQKCLFNNIFMFFLSIRFCQRKMICGFLVIKTLISLFV